MENSNQQKYIVVDTSALIEIPDVIQRVDPAMVFVPLTVIKQLDALKNNPDIERSKKARSASFFIDEGMKNGNVTVLTAYDQVDGLDNTSDNKIVGAAVRLKRENPEAVVALLATDRNMRIVAGGFGIITLGGWSPSNKKVKKIISPAFSSVFNYAGYAGVACAILAMNYSFLVGMVLVTLSAAALFIGFSTFFVNAIASSPTYNDINETIEPSYIIKNTQRGYDYDDYLFYH